MTFTTLTFVLFLALVFGLYWSSKGRVGQNTIVVVSARISESRGGSALNANLIPVISIAMPKMVSGNMLKPPARKKSSMQTKPRPGGQRDTPARKKIARRESASVARTLGRAGPLWANKFSASRCDT